MNVTFTLPTLQLLILAAGVVLPLLVGLVTTRVTSAGTKAVLLAALALVSQLAGELITSIQDGSSYDLGIGLTLGLGSFLVAVGTHFGIWKPTGLAGKAADALISDAPKHRAAD